MACTPTPTQTLFEVVTTSTVTTSTVEVLTTIPPELSTTYTTYCGLSTVDTNGTTKCALTESSEIVKTIHTEEITTTDSQIVLEIPVITSIPTSTLFSTCPNNASLPISNPPTSLPSSSLILSSSSSTLPDGSVIVTVLTATTVVPTWALIPPDVGDHRGSDGELGPILGASIGGLVGLLLVALLAWSIWRKRDTIHAMHLRDEIWGSEHAALYGRRAKIDSVIEVEEPEPKPYEYGLVGRREMSAHDSSPNPSPNPTPPESLAHVGMSPGPYSAFSPTPYLSGFSPGPYNSAFQQPLPSIPTAQLSPLPPAVPAPTHHHTSDSITSVGTAVSYPYQVPVPVDQDADPATGRRPRRMSLKLTNWNPETDGELFVRASEESERSAVEGIRLRRSSK